MHTNVNTNCIHLRQRVYSCPTRCRFVKFAMVREESKSRKIDPLVIGMLAFSLIVRVFFHIQYSGTIFWGDLSIDEHLHHAWAQYIANGDFIGDEVFFRAPLYPYFLALLYKISGADLHFVLLAQHAIGVFSGWLIYRTGREIISYNTGILALVLYCLTPIFIYFEGQLLLDFLIIPFILLSLLFLKRAFDRKSLTCYALSGVALGLAALTRPNILAFLPFLIVWLLVHVAREDNLRRAVTRSLVLTACTFLIILPITVRNYVLGNDTVLIASQGGINFYLGNNEDATGLSAYMPGLGFAWDYADCEFIAEQELGGELKPSEVSDYWYDRGLKFVLDESDQFVPLFFKKLYHLVNTHEISNNRSIPYVFDEAWILSLLPVGVWLILPLSIVGFVYGFRDRWIKLIGILLSVYSFTLLLFFINSRFRIPIIAVALILAACGIERLVNLVIEKKQLQLLISVIFIVAVALFSGTNLYNTDFDDRSSEEFNIGNRFFELGDLDAALTHYHSALSSQPHTSQINLNIGNIHMKRGELDSARIYYLRELEVTPDSVRAFNNLSVVERLDGNDSLSLEYSERALSAKPYYADAVVNYIITCRKIGAYRKGMDAANAALDFETRNPELYYYRGVLFFDRNQLPEALSDFSRAESLLTAASQPSFSLQDNIVNPTARASERRHLEAKIKYSIGTIRGRAGDAQAAIEYLTEALKLDPALNEARTNLASALVQTGRFREAIEQTELVIREDAAGALTWYLTAVAHANLGNLESALIAADSALSISPGYAPAISLKQLLSNQKETGEE